MNLYASDHELCNAESRELLGVPRGGLIFIKYRRMFSYHLVIVSGVYYNITNAQKIGTAPPDKNVLVYMNCICFVTLLIFIVSYVVNNV